MDQRLAEHDHVARRHRHLYGQVAVERPGKGEPLFVTARDAHEPAGRRWVIDQGPLGGHEPGADAPPIEQVVLRRVERHGATVEAQAARPPRHHDAVGVVQAYVRRTPHARSPRRRGDR